MTKAEQEIMDVFMNVKRDNGTMTINYMTSQQLFDICQKHDYLLLRTESDNQMAINCKAARLARKRSFAPETIFISYKPCDFHTYISRKRPFI